MHLFDSIFEEVNVNLQNLEPEFLAFFLQIVLNHLVFLNLVFYILFNVTRKLLRIVMSFVKTYLLSYKLLGNFAL